MFYDKEVGAIVTDYWDLHQLFSDKDPAGAEEGAFAQRIFDLLKGTFDRQQVPWTNVIGYAADGASVMMGCNNSVATRLKDLCPGIRVSRCICHSLHLCASEACKQLPRSAEDLARNIYNFLHNSSKRQAQFAEFQTFLHLDVLQMLHPSQTRWLSLAAVVDRILKQWDALRLYFDAKLLEERLETAERIHTMLNDKFTKMYYIFLDWMLPKVTGLNEYFQSSRPVLPFVHEKMTETFREILTCFMRRDYVCMTPTHNIQPMDTSKWLPLGDIIYFGVGVAEVLGLPEVRADTARVKDFKTRARQFMATLCSEMQRRYDFNDPVLQRASSLAPATALSQRAREATPSLRTLALLLPRIVDKTDKKKLQDLDDQWRALPFAAEILPTEVRECKDAGVFWHQV
ncbi:Zinc finger protein 862 [Frankliniella fusca]|uniref:Zinc finger protein 862 n=1 Tax=Frankliniella fusca TaxID=407009 RepID=A0AAE1LBV6_9NEOP|nr:Zinc finger protein 862 [Frankliniella fusca]